MTPLSNISCSFRFAINSDIEKIHTWLIAQESQEAGFSFLCNWNLTLWVYSEGKLMVAVSKNEPIAYMWADFGVVEVHENYRRRGIGRSLVEFGLEHVKKSDSSCVSIECSPQTSIPFWKNMGFKLYNEKYAYLILEKTLPFPKEGCPINIEINFYPESKKWLPETNALEAFSPLALKAPNHTIYLKNRVAIFSKKPIWNSDPVVGIKISGKEIYLDKAKYQMAKDIGVQYDGSSFAIENINTRD